MSAWIVSADHVDAMLRAARDYGYTYSGGRFRWSDPNGNDHECRTWDHDSMTRTGMMLLGECVASVAYRYSDEPDDRLPGGTTRPEDYTYEGDDHPAPNIGQALKLLDSYEYQSCEHPGWRESSARAFCDALRMAVCTHVPGYESGQWDYLHPLGVTA